MSGLRWRDHTMLHRLLGSQLAGRERQGANRKQRERERERIKTRLKTSDLSPSPGILSSA